MAEQLDLEDYIEEQGGKRGRVLLECRARMEEEIKEDVYKYGTFNIEDLDWHLEKYGLKIVLDKQA